MTGTALATRIVEITARRDDEISLVIGECYRGEIDKRDRTARIADAREHWRTEVFQACSEETPAFEPGWFLEGD